jgi:hypothetical protein
MEVSMFPIPKKDSQDTLLEKKVKKDLMNPLFTEKEFSDVTLINI